MKRLYIYYVSLFFIIFQSCHTANEQQKEVLPLQEVYTYFDELSQKEFHFTDLDHKLSTAKGTNNTEEIAKYTKEFEVSQASCIQKMETRFPIGNVKIPFEQINGKDTLTITSVYVSAFSFPWSTATSICFYFTVDYVLHKSDLLFVPISVKFFDSENDIIHVCTLTASTGGKTKFLVSAQFPFRKLKNIIINQD